MADTAAQTTGNITLGHNNKFQNHFGVWNKILVL